MLEEASSAPDAVAGQLRRNAALLHELGGRIRALSPRLVLTCARGSSDHAATYGKYLIERFAGVPTASFAPSISSVYARRQSLQGGLFIALSQSGRSPDILSAAQAAADGGALVLAIVNETDSPLAGVADVVVPVHAGPERSVAATKSYIGTLTALVGLVAAWTRDDGLGDALRDVPQRLREAWRLDWSQAVAPLLEAGSLFVVGRGLGLGIAQEAALKFKETCRLHAEAYSAAELRHGPIAIVEAGFPVLVLTQADETRDGVGSVIDELAGLGARVIAAGTEHQSAVSLPTLRTAAPPLEPILLVQSFYRMVGALAVARGCDPDRPPHLRKVTETR